MSMLVRLNRVLAALGLLSLWVSSARGASGQDIAPQASLLRSAAGANAAAIQATVDQFRVDLGGVNHGAGGTFPTGRREINWDGVPDGFSAPASLPANFFNVNSPRGVLFSTSGTGFQVSMDDDNPADADPDQVRFSHLNATYSAIFQTFSPQRLFSPINSHVIDATFFVPGTSITATVTGFGAVFADVDSATATTLQFFDGDGNSLGVFAVAPANNGLSFLGVSFTGGERAARVRLTLGNSALTPGDGGATDVVVLDDVIYGEPQGIPMASLYAVTTSNQLVRFEDTIPGTLLSTVSLTGLQLGETILAIDIRPATKQLYALGSSSRLYTLDSSTGAATLVGSGAFSPTLSGTEFGMDFNPVSDRIRVVSDAEQNLRLNPTTGAVAAVDVNLSPAGNVVGSAYDRNFAGATATTLFGVDSSSDQLVRIGGVDGIPSANGGVITTIGPLGVDTSALVGLDISSSGKAYASLTVGGTPGLYLVNLTTGAATLLGTIGNGSLPIRDIAVMPPPVVYLPLIMK